MNIKKILRFYLIFILTITFASSLSYNDRINNYFSHSYTNVINTLDFYIDDSKLKYVDHAPSSAIYSVNKFSQKSDSTFQSQNANSHIINFDIINDTEDMFASPGEKGVEIMQFVFKTKDELLELRELNLKIIGVDPAQITKANLFDGEKLIGSVAPSDEYLRFAGIDYRLEPASKGILTLKLDLSVNLRTNDRIRLDIESVEDIALNVGETPYSINEYYPIKGKYLSISKPRSLGSVEKATKE